MRQVAPVRLLDAAPWLGEGLEDDSLAQARRLIVPSYSHRPGPLRWPDPAPAVGLVVLGGRIARGLRVDDAPAHGIEMLGEGDILRPWSFSAAAASIPSEPEWDVVATARFAVLDRAFLAAMSHWPQLAVNLIDAGTERARTLAYFLTVRQVSRLEGRILLTLWRLADRWGKVTPEGVVLELPSLTHERIARMVAARRPSVTTSIRHLRELGVVTTGRRGRWTLLGDPVEALHTVRAAVPAPDAPEPSQ